MHTPCHARPWVGAEPGLVKGQATWRTRESHLWDKRNSERPPGFQPGSPQSPAKSPSSPPRDVSKPYVREDPNPDPALKPGTNPSPHLTVTLISTLR